MADRVTNIVVAGLGGQGVLTAADILAEAALRAGYDVKKSEIHGMSQRGGSVSSDIRFGPKVWSPMISRGEADFLVLLRLEELATVQPLLRPGAPVFGPEEALADRLEGGYLLNTALLGRLSARLEIAEAHWMEALRAGIKSEYLDENLEAFALGRGFGLG